MDTLSKEEWAALSANLREPFQPEDIDFRPGARTKDKSKALALAYVNSRAVQDRLDRLVGAENWSYTYEPLAISNDHVLKLVKACLTIYGVSKYDIGEASERAPSMGCVSHGLKRVAVQFGMGRDLYELKQVWLPLDGNDRFSDQDIARLRASLPKPKTHTAQDATSGAPVEQEPEPGAPRFVVTPTQPSEPAAPVTRQRSAEPPDERAHTKPGVSFPQFLKLIDELGFSQAEAMKALGVRSFAGLNLDEALLTLEGLAGASPIADAIGAMIEDIAPAPADAPTPAYPEDIRADGTSDIALATFLGECAKLGYKGDGALKRIQEALGVSDLMGVSYTKALKKLAGASEPPKRTPGKTAGASKSEQVKSEPGGGENGRRALRRLALEAGIADADYLAEYAMLFGDDYSHDNEVAWSAYLEGKKAELVRKSDLKALGATPLN